jgi:hypothetical protein
MSSKLYLLEVTEAAGKTVASTRRPAAVKRGAAFSEGWRMGKELAGYKDGKDGTPASPIWGKTRAEVFGMIEDLYVEALKALKDGDSLKFRLASENVSMLKSELAKRTAAGEMARTARKA